MLKLNKKRTYLIIAVLGLLIFLHYINILRPVENAVIFILNPIFRQAQNWGTNITEYYNDVNNKEDLVSENKRLKHELNNLLVENAQLRILTEENKVLRENLRFFADKDIEYVMSHVVSRSESLDITEKSNSITIDKGEKDGVRNGLAVINGQGIIIGKVIDTKDHSAKVYLSNNPECKMAATILNSEETTGVTEGELGLTIKMGFIPQSEELKIGELVVTSGLEESIPRGLVIGKIASIQKESNELWQSALIEPLVNMDEILIVSVLIP